MCDRWRAVVLNAMAKVVEGLSTLCPPRLFGIGDRRHGQSVDNPASRSAIDPAEDRSQCRRGSSCRKRAVSDGARQDRTSPFHWGPPGRAGCASLHGFERGDVCLGGWSPMAAVVGGFPQHLGVNGERYRGQGVDDPVSGVPRADAGAACPRRRNIARFKKASRPRAAPRRTSPSSCGGGQPGTWSTVVLRAAARRAHRKRWKGRCSHPCSLLGRSPAGVLEQART